jgi:hypothetical protein
MKASIHYVRLTGRVTVTLIFNLEKDTWIIINDGTRGCIRDKLDQSGQDIKERTHHHFWIGTRDYELVVDPTEEGNQWESFSFFDVKKQNYIDNAHGKINEGTE